MSCHFQVDGVDVTNNLPVKKSGFEVGFNGRYVYVTLDSGVSVLFDGNAELKVESPSRPYSNKLCGLCGNFDGDHDNDYVLKDGTDVRDMEKGTRDYKIGYGWSIHDDNDHKYGYPDFFHFIKSFSLYNLEK